MNQTVQEIALLMITSLSFALGFGWLGHPHLLGYIATGVALGPFFQQSDHYYLIDLLGQFGMIMLVFMIGIEFDLCSFKKNWKNTFLIFISQLSISFVISLFLGKIFALPYQLSVMLSFLLTLSSTAVVVKLLEEMKILQTNVGSIIINILIVQDLAIIPMLIILKGFQHQQSFINVFSKVMLSVALLSFLISYLSFSKKKHHLSFIKKLFDQNQEIMTLASITACFVFSALSDLIGLSHTYGAFLIGLILGNVCNKEDIIHYTKPISSLLMMMFFIFIGSKIKLSYVWDNLFLLSICSFIFVFIKIIMNYVILIFFGIKSRKSFFISSMLSQASEFSFAFINIVASGLILSSADENFLNTIVVISLTLGAVLPLISDYYFEYLNETKTR